jgi:hypothetical protein
MEIECPACGAMNREKTWQCLCGHYFVVSPPPQAGPKKETIFPREQIESQAMSIRTAPIPGKPVDTPAAIELASAPAEQPVSTPAREPVSALAKEPESVLVREPVSASAEQTVSAPVKEPVSTPAREIVSAPAKEPELPPAKEPASTQPEEPERAPAPGSVPVNEPESASAREPVGSPRKRHREFNYRLEWYRLCGRAVVKITLLLLTPALWIAGAVGVFPALLKEGLPITLLSMLLFFGFGLLLFWLTNVLSVLFIGERTCYPATSRFWSHETEYLIQKLRARKRAQRNI